MHHSLAPALSALGVGVGEPAAAPELSATSSLEELLGPCITVRGTKPLGP